MSRVRLIPNTQRIIFNERVMLRIVDLDARCESELKTGESFRVTEPGKTDENAEPGMYSIHSPMFGTEWGDEDAFEYMWSCECRTYVGKYYADKNFVCPNCKKPVTYTGTDMRKHAWIMLDRFSLIHPQLMQMIESFIGTEVFDNIIKYRSPLEDVDEPELSPFARIGIIAFKERFDEIMEYFVKKNKKYAAYEFIMKHRNKVFTHAIPVYTSMLRHYTIKDGKFKYTEDDKLFKRLYTNSTLINNMFVLKRKQQAAEKRGNVKGIERLRTENILYRMQVDYIKLWKFSFEMLDDKGGIINGQIIAGRMDYTARNVITSDSTLHQDEADIGYTTALEEFKLEFLDVASRMYDISHKAAYNIWREATMQYSEKVYNILVHILNLTPRIMSLYRNPSINYGSKFVCKIRRITKGIDDCCLVLNPNVLIKPNADFDGDIMAEIHHKIEEVARDAFENLNPRSNFMIDRNTGEFDRDSNIYKDQAAILYGLLNM